MTNNDHYDAIIIGGSYSGLSAGMSLGRSFRRVLIIDSGNPCNKQTPHSHNFITHDGHKPAQIAAEAKTQLRLYKTIEFHDGVAVSGQKTETGFRIRTQTGELFSAKKLLFATGLRDVMPDIGGFAECWGISILHCPYCHGYEIANEKTGLIGNDDMGFEFAKMIAHWTSDLTVLTNGKSTLTAEQTQLLQKHGIAIIETPIDSMRHTNGQLSHVVFKDGSLLELKAVYARPECVQQCSIPEELGCELTEHGSILVDHFQKTSVHGIYACGDNSSFARAVSTAVAAGTTAGAFLNKELIEEEF
jgi:thioredoxin reductase